MGRITTVLEKFRDRLAVVEDIHGSAVAVGESLRGIDAQGVVEGAEHLGHVQGPILGIFAAAAGGADGLTHLQAAARHQGGHDRRPVIPAAVVIVDLRRSAELAPHHRHHVLVQAAIVQVLNEIGDAAVHLGELISERLEIAAVRIPAADGQGHAADARFNEPARGQERFHSLVAIANPRIFMGQIQRFAHRARSDHVEGPSGEGIHAAHGVRGIDVAADGIEGVQQGFPIRHALGIDSPGHAQVVEPRSVGSEWSMPDTEITWLGAHGRSSQADKRRDVAGRAAQFGHHGAERRMMGNAVGVFAVAGHDQRIGVLFYGNK